MQVSFFFYDLETSGFNAHSARIMQFAGQRTDMELNPVGEPVNKLIRLTPDVVPDPDAVLVTGITPQTTLADGITEAEFLKLFYGSVCRPGTIFLGFNSIRFDDEFMRFLMYRNFYDAYRWQWSDGCSKWDMLDVVRMTRALRPDGIKWPFAADGTPSNRLELLSSVNGLDHTDAHDALSDVWATIAVAKLIREKQPKLFGYLLDMRDKKAVKDLAEGGHPFVYTSGAYQSEHEKTTVVVRVADDPKSQGALVYDLRYDPAPFANLSVSQLADRWRWRKDRKPDELPFPVKVLRYNRCPAIAPLSTLDISSQQRVHIDKHLIENNRKKLAAITDLGQKLVDAQKALGQERPQSELLGNEQAVDGQLYDGFLDKRDDAAMQTVQAADAAALAKLEANFHDTRLNALLPLYKARNFPASLTNEERQIWEEFRSRRLLDGGAQSRLARYFGRLQTLAGLPDTTPEQQYLLEELRLYGESVAPGIDA